MKGNKKILVVAILLLLIAVSYGTYAIYKTSVTTNATVTAAAWNIEFKDGATTITDSTTVTFSASDCVNPHVATGFIAPGATCSKQITLDATGTQVDVAYEVDVDDTAITATKDATSVSTAGANEFSATVTGGSTGTLLMSEGLTKTITVNLEWAGTDSDTTINPADTALAGSTITVPLTLTAKQLIGS